MRRHFSTDRPSLLFPFSFSRHLTLSRHLHEVVLRRREVNKGEKEEEEEDGASSQGDRL